jgi:hypothetical protein
MKKLWDNPELTVLVRRKSDEVILSNCHSSGFGNAHGQCDTPDNDNKYCK